MQRVKPALRGFTLIELLMVIAIIAILSTVVLASLANARTKAVVAAMSHELTDMRPAAMNDFLTTNDFSLACDPTSSSGKLFRDAVAKGGSAVSGVCINSTTGTYYSVSAGMIIGLSSGTGGTDGWAVSLLLPNGKYYCTDYLGNATTTAALTIHPPNATDVDCN